MSRRQFDPPLEHRDVAFQRHDVGLDPLWNVMTLDLNVATLVLHFSRTSLRWIQRRNVSFNHSLERRDFGSNVATLVLTILCNVATLAAFLSGTSRRCILTSRRWPCLRLKTPSFCSYHVLFLPEPYSIPIVVPTTPTLAGIHSHTCRRPLFFPPTTSPTLPLPFTHHTTIPISSLSHHALVSLTRLGFVRPC